MFIRLLSFERSLASACAKCISLNNRSSLVRPTIIDINSNEPLYYLFTFSIDKFGGSYWQSIFSNMCSKKNKRIWM